jgi:hypothetical protein
VPAEVRAQTPLEPGERILLFARDTAGGLVAATERALRHQAGGGWSRYGWEQVTRVRWDDDLHTLTVTDVSAGHVAAISLHSSDGARLAGFARERINSTFLLSTLVPLAGHRPARVTARRRPARDELAWQVSLDDPAAAVDPAIRAHLAAAIAQLRGHIGM